MCARTTILEMAGFQAANIDAFRSERVVCVVKAGEVMAKAFQIVFAADGSLFTQEKGV
jgi:hypothetical protein